MKILSLCALGSLAALVSGLGLKFDKRADLPTLTLPYGTWRANSYDSARDIYTFKNIRYAAPPTGNRRFAKPEPPEYNATVQDGSYGNSCPQAPSKLSALGPVNEIPVVGGLLNGFISGIIPFVTGIGAGGREDCLFLDVYVPGTAIRGEKKNLPVVVWTYGGAFIFGNKDQGVGILPFYQGYGPMQQAQNKYIFVSYNYRVGAFGFLAGTTLEQQGQTNVGFYDQRMLYQWVQSYINLLGGDKSQVIAWGESAGASSIMHHLTAFGGKQDPLFKRAFLQSTPSEAFIDRRGLVEDIYTEFESLAGCSGRGLACLRAVPEDELIKANLKLTMNVPSGAFKPGPAADGQWVRQAPALELASGNYWKGIEGLILSHVQDEPQLFTTGDLQTDDQFRELTEFIIPSYVPKVRKAMLDFYPSPNNLSSPYRTQTDRAKQYQADTVFLCNYRYLAKAYENKIWALQYSVTPGWHAFDLLPTFYDAYFPLQNTNQSLPIPIIPGFGGLSTAYQSYLNSFSLTGDPNTNRLPLNLPPTINWPRPGGIDNEKMTGLLNVGDLGFSIIRDDVALKSHCDFFLNVQAAITEGGGYVPPGGSVPNNLGVKNLSPSANYTTPNQSSPQIRVLREN